MRVHRMSREDDAFAAVQIEFNEDEANAIVKELADAHRHLNHVPHLAELLRKISTIYR